MFLRYQNLFLIPTYDKMNIIKSFSDNIIVLNEGRIIETGTHDSLLKAKQLYCTLWNEYVASIDGDH